MFLELIDIFMNSRPCFNPLHLRDFMNLNDDVYCVVFFHVIFHCVKICGLMKNLIVKSPWREMHHPLQPMI